MSSCNDLIWHQKKVIQFWTNKSLFFKKPTNFQLKALTMSSSENASYLKEVQEALQDDPFVENIRKNSCTNKVNDELEFKDGLLYFKGFLYIPLGPIQLKIIQMRYNLSVVGHFGFSKTKELIS